VHGRGFTRAGVAALGHGSRMQDLKMSSPKLPIGVSLIARNEAHNLPRSLKSVVDWASEIVVVINDCTDETAAVAKQYGARVFEHSWKGFREQKNVSLSFVSQPWVLALDADEEVSADLRRSIVGFFAGDHLRFRGAYFPRKVWFLGRWITHGDWYPDYVTRLFAREHGQWTGSTEHCKVTIDGPVQKLQGDLLHYSNPDMASHIRKMPYYADIFLERQLAEQVRWSVWPAVFRPAWRFLRAYFFRLGLLDGFPGFYIAAATAFATFVRYSRLYEHRYQDHRSP
jgi:glycosyltransferase involved in cell wall biosynthesis